MVVRGWFRTDPLVPAMHHARLLRLNFKAACQQIIYSVIFRVGSPSGIPSAQHVAPTVCCCCRRPSMQQLLYAVLEHMGSSLSTAFANLPAAAGPAASGSAAAGCPVESLGQYFMDLVYLDATLSKAGGSTTGVRLQQQGMQQSSCQCVGESAVVWYPY